MAGSVQGNQADQAKVTVLFTPLNPTALLESIQALLHPRLINCSLGYPNQPTQVNICKLRPAGLNPKDIIYD